MNSPIPTRLALVAMVGGSLLSTGAATAAPVFSEPFELSLHGTSGPSVLSPVFAPVDLSTISPDSFELRLFSEPPLDGVRLVIDDGDFDGDRLPNAWEEQFDGPDPLVADALDSDDDADGITLLEEYVFVGNPGLSDAGVNPPQFHQIGGQPPVIEIVRATHVGPGDGPITLAPSYGFDLETATWTTRPDSGQLEAPDSPYTAPDGFSYLIREASSGDAPYEVVLTFPLEAPFDGDFFTRFLLQAPEPPNP